MTDILNSTDAGVLTITFNRPTRKNAITQAMYTELARLLAQADDDSAVRCVVIQGDASAFSRCGTLDRRLGPEARVKDDGGK